MSFGGRGKKKLTASTGTTRTGRGHRGGSRGRIGGKGDTDAQRDYWLNRLVDDSGGTVGYDGNTTTATPVKGTTHSGVASNARLSGSAEDGHGPSSHDDYATQRRRLLASMGKSADALDDRNATTPTTLGGMLDDTEGLDSLANQRLRSVQTMNKWLESDLRLANSRRIDAEEALQALQNESRERVASLEHSLATAQSKAELSQLEQTDLRRQLDAANALARDTQGRMEALDIRLREERLARQQMSDNMGHLDNSGDVRASANSSGGGAEFVTVRATEVEDYQAAVIELSKIREERDHLLLQLETTQAEAESLRGTVGQLTEQRSQASDDLATALNDVTALREEREVLYQSQRMALQQNATLERTIESLEARCATLTAEAKGLTLEATVASERVDGLLARAESAEHQERELSQQLEVLRMSADDQLRYKTRLLDKAKRYAPTAIAALESRHESVSIYSSSSTLPPSAVNTPVRSDGQRGQRQQQQQQRQQQQRQQRQQEDGGEFGLEKVSTYALERVAQANVSSVGGDVHDSGRKSVASLMTAMLNVQGLHGANGTSNDWMNASLGDTPAHGRGGGNEIHSDSDETDSENIVSDDGGNDDELLGSLDLQDVSPDKWISANGQQQRKPKPNKRNRLGIQATARNVASVTAVAPAVAAHHGRSGGNPINQSLRR